MQYHAIFRLYLFMADPTKPGKGKNMSITRIALTLLLLAFIAGCAPVISEETMRTVDRSVRFQDIVKDPGAFKGRPVVFGGTIIDTENREGTTVIEVLQEGLNSQLRPVEPNESAGRFLAEIDGFRDPAIYAPGKGITIAGEVTGTERRKLGKGSYSYPVIKTREHYLWEDRRYDPGPRIGIGIGLGYTHID